ncbi:major facilitator superfamily domain-containing protein [Aspergillus pseudoustus]|uniref:Major facilitator superfamily domain-containing protein n=1 Tax=Aspergillus pseudoustus TaxID=1810923 RepID=A0ABR4IBZ3_9EURO
MAFGILSPSESQGHTVGTSLLVTNGVGEPPAVSGLAHGTGRHSKTILIPQPSRDPNDPLRWPLWQRDLMFFMYMYCTILCVGGIGPMLSASAAVLAESFNVSFTDVTLLTGYNTCAVGAGGILLSALSRKFGKRPGFIFSMVCAFAGTVWGGAAQSYNSLLGARVLQGLGVSMFESVMFAVIGDLYYVHERGARVAALTIAISGIANLPALLSGLITDRLGWRWNFWMLAIFLGIGLGLVLLFAWEPAYNRPPDISILDEQSSDKNADDTNVDDVRRKGSHLEQFGASESEIVYPLQMVLKPFTILIHPAVVWATLLLSISTAWYVVISFVIAQIFSAAPYFLDAVDIGYMSAGPAVGGTVGSIVCGLLSDPLATALARKNNGIYEPEFRLVLILPMLVSCCIGWFQFGHLVDAGKSPAVIAVIWSIATSSLQFCASAIGTYILDAYPGISSEVFIIGMVTKNFVFFGLSFGVNDWVTAWGPSKVFDTIGGIQVGLCLLSGLVWVYGKKWRAHYYQ